jgi:bifunctional oligoribonuclease and PAP phosphatase NrnA
MNYIDWLSLNLTELKEKLNHTGIKIAIITHRNPDGDAIGSILGLYGILKKLGHEVGMVVPNDYPAFLKWMPEAKEILVFSKNKEKSGKLLETAEMIFALDFNDLSRVHEFEGLITGHSAYKIFIDHHPDPGKVADLMISTTEVSSTAELVYYFLHEIGLNHLFDKDIASSLFTGIMTDTGCFSFNSSNPETYHAIADLLKYGIEKDKIYSEVYDNFSYNRMRLMGYCLNNKMQYLPEFRTAFISLSASELKEYNFTVGDSEGFVNLPLSVEGVIFSALFIENKDRIRISFRSKGSFPTNKLSAKHFNGGGHVNASGGELFDSLERSIEKFIKILPDYKDELFRD